MTQALEQEVVKAFSERCAAIIDKAGGNGSGLASQLLHLESPLEKIMIMALQTVAHAGICDINLVNGKTETEPVSWKQNFIILPQYPIGRYTADFMINPHYLLDYFAPVAGRRERRKWIVECDGFNFHNSTREQVAHDHARNRYMMSLGYGVIRFLYDEIVESPFGCACEALTIASNGALRFRDDGAASGDWPTLTGSHALFYPDWLFAKEGGDDGAR